MRGCVEKGLAIAAMERRGSLGVNVDELGDIYYGLFIAIHIDQIQISYY